MLRCLIVDDSTLFVQAARTLLERQGVLVVGVASTTVEALQRAEELRPDVALIDIHLGDESGFDLVWRLTREVGLPPARMLLISTHAEDDYADMIATTPVSGFLAKSSLSADAIRDLLGSRGDGDPFTVVSGPPGR
jgi:DNA-binding NarL/FixJ family response regulator